MTSLSYHPRFGAQVAAGTKPNTIRAPRKVPIKRGDFLQHFTGMRTKHCIRLGESQCLGVFDILIDVTGREINIHPVYLDVLRRDGFVPPAGDLTAETLARLDGFSSVDDFFRYFEPVAGCDAFQGHLYYWGRTFEPHHAPGAVSEGAMADLRHLLGMNRRDGLIMTHPRGFSLPTEPELPPYILELEQAGYMRRGLVYSTYIHFHPTIHGMRAAGLKDAVIKRAFAHSQRRP